MKHLFISREYPPAPYAGGGIGTYVLRIAHLLAQAGEIVHVIGQQSPAASRSLEVAVEGRLTVHRIPLDRPLNLPGIDPRAQRHRLDDFARSIVPSQGFAWQAALFAEHLIERESIDVIEAQEYEAPLYFLMLRRAAGEGVVRAVPMVVHLHSPSEWVFTYNEAQDRPDFDPLTRLEEYTIRSADALLSPSRFLAEAVESRYALERGTVRVIPYPIDPVARPVARTEATWRTGTVCYVGRLEPRKGVREWVEAAVSVGATYSEQRFTFVGEDTPYKRAGGGSMRAMLRASIPAEFQARFSFTGSVRPDQLASYRAASRIAVVPSRWENYPNTCLEAMASGLPVLVSPNGGMREMVEDGRTGWIAAGADAASLAHAARRALDTPPALLAAMGRAAAESIESRCDAQRVVGDHLSFKSDVITRSSRHGSGVPHPVPVPEAPPVPGRRAATYGIQTTTLSPTELLHAPRGQQAAVLRRAMRDPRYAIRWIAWHVQRYASQLVRPRG